MPVTFTEDAGRRFAIAPDPEPAEDAPHRVFAIFVSLHPRAAWALSRK